MIWSGKVVSVNRWTRARVVRRKNDGKYIATVYTTHEYKDFVTSLSAALLADERVRYGKQYVDVTITCYMWKMRDTDSIIKPVLDALEKAKIVDNDRYVRDIAVHRYYNDRDELDQVEVEIIPADGAGRHEKISCEADSADV